MSAQAFETPIFLYGTLRAGEGLSHLIPKGHTRSAASVPGRLYYSPNTTAYPVLLPALDKDDRVQGEVVFVDLESKAIAYVVLMELQSGYSATWCVLDVPGMGSVNALTFTWHPGDGRGQRIVSGDWSERAVGRVHFQCRDCHSVWPTENEADECEWQHDVADNLNHLNYAITKDTAQ